MDDSEKLIRVFIGGLYARVPFYTNAEDSFYELISRSGFNLVEDMRDADIFIAMDLVEKEIFKWEMYGKSKQLAFLIRNEPKVVWPTNYRQLLLAKFGTVIDIGRFNKNADFESVWPQFWPEEASTNDFRFDDGIVIVSGNKLSFIFGELYSLRRRCIFNIPQIAHYGNNWDLGFLDKVKTVVLELLKVLESKSLPNPNSFKFWFRKYINWLGAPYDKKSCLSIYKYSLVIENSADYMSEKLFDAFFACTVPIYVGPCVRKYGIPENLVIQCEPNLRSIRDGIKRAQKVNYVEWCDEINSWLNSAETRANWDGYEVYGRIIDEIKKKAAKSNLKL